MFVESKVEGVDYLDAFDVFSFGVLEFDYELFKITYYFPATAVVVI